MFKILLLAIVFSLGLSLSSPVFADVTVGADGFNVFEILRVDEGGTVEGSTTITERLRQVADEKYDGNVPVAIIMWVINILMLLIGTFAFLVIFYSGLLLVTANGDEGKIDKGKGMIWPSILGLLFAFLAYYIASFVQSFFY